MGNMSYCRFRNTLEDLKECYDYIDWDDLSEDEEKARNELIALCKKIGCEKDDN